MPYSDDAQLLGMHMHRSPDNQHDLAVHLGPTVRPLQGLNEMKRGSSLPLLPGDAFKTFAEARTPAKDAEMITVSIGAVPIGVNLVGGEGVGQRVELIGRILWGIGGAQYEAIFDVMNGTSFSVPANYIRLDIRYPGDPLPGSVPVQVSGGFAYGTIGQRSSPIRFTQDVGPILAGATTELVIPEFATSFIVLENQGITSPFIPPAPPFVPLDIIVSEETAAGGLTCAFQLTDNTNFGSQIESTFPIFNSAKIITIGTMTQISGCKIIYNLSL